MPFKPFRKRKKDATVSTDSLSDVAFLLIIFFILATTIQRIVGFQTDLPSGRRNEQTKTDDKTPTVGLKGSRLTFNDSEISMGDLKKKLADLRLDSKSDEKKVVLLDSSPDVGYQNYFEVMSAITAAGGMIGILTEDE